MKHIVSKTYKPLLVRYLSKTRTYRYNDIELEIPPQVFHPGFFFSTRILLKYILALPLDRKYFLELGAGSGLIAFSAVKKGADVTATDINPIAIEFLHRNSKHNNLPINIIESDLFTEIPKQIFDIVAINPPYYKRNPTSYEDHAWYCGEKGEYYEKLFLQLGAFIHTSSVVLMTLCDGCDIELIKNIAAKYGFEMKLTQTRKNMLEKNFIYTICKTNS